MNNEQFIKQLIAEGEGHQVEFKTTMNNHDVGKTICGFLNADGGQLLVGVADDGTPVGVPNAKAIKEEIETFLINEILPDAPIMVSEESLDDKKLILIKVWAGSKQPYIFDGNIFYRANQNTVKATSEEISKLIHNRQSTELHWERQPVFGVDDDDIDFDEIKKTIHNASKINRRQDFNFEPESFLEYYGLSKNGNFTNAAVVLFAKNPARFIPQSRVRLAFLPEGKTGDTYHDDQLLEGNLFDNIRSILNFLDKHLPTRRAFKQDEWQRKDDSVFPGPALREGILNALVHRSYVSYNDSMSIILYGDRLEITNSGTSPLKVTELRKNHLSMPVNPDIAHILFLRGYIEKLGRGTLKIIDMFKEAGLKAPIWKIDNKSVKLTFISNVNLVPSSEAAVKGTIKGTVEGTIEGTAEGTIEGIVKGTIEGSTEQVQEKLVVVLDAIVSNEGKRLPEYQEVTGIAVGSLERYIKLLRDAKLIEFKGESLQTGGYFTTKLFSRKLKK